MEQQISLIIFASENGRDGWQLMKPEDVPEWVKAPANVARMVNGEQCVKCDEGKKGSLWYRALRTADYERLVKAQRRREAGNRKRLAH